MKWFLIVLMVAPFPSQRELSFPDRATCIEQRDRLRQLAEKERIRVSIVCEPNLRWNQ